MKSKWLIALIVIFAVLFVTSAVLLIIYFSESDAQATIYDELAEKLEQAKETAAEEPGEDPYVTVLAPDGSSMKILPEFQTLYEENPDIAGWISIDGTALNYPVVYKPTSKDFYLRKNFYGEKARQGCLYIQETCSISPASDQIVIFGHNMKDGSMFACLKNYLKKEFYDAHKVITFNTLTERASYEIFTVFTASASVDNDYPFYQYINLSSEYTFLDFVAPAMTKSVYDNGVQPQFGDKILTLVTCEYSQENGRLVVMARKIS